MSLTQATKKVQLSVAFLSVLAVGLVTAAGLIAYVFTEVNKLLKGMV